MIGALAVVNAAGDVLDWRAGRIIAGARRADGTFRRQRRRDAIDRDQPQGRHASGSGARQHHARRRRHQRHPPEDGVNAKTRDDGELRRRARDLCPYHTTGDGDQLFAVSTARIQRPDLPLTMIGALAADLIAEAIVRGVRAAKERA